MAFGGKTNNQNQKHMADRVKQAQEETEAMDLVSISPKQKDKEQDTEAAPVERQVRHRSVSPAREASQCTTSPATQISPSGQRAAQDPYMPPSSQPVALESAVPNFEEQEIDQDYLDELQQAVEGGATSRRTTVFFIFAFFLFLRQTASN